MADTIHVLARRNLDRSPSPRDVAAVFFRHKRLLLVSFPLVLAAGVLYAVLAPSYKAEMKVLVRRGRIDPAVTPTQTASPAFEHDEVTEEVVSLVRQVFFPTAVIQRACVLFAAADAETRISAVCEQAGRALAEMSGAMVAIVEASPSSAATLATKKPPRNSTGAEWWRGYSSQIAENLWRVPSALMNAPAQVGGVSSQTLDLPFDYALFAASLADSETPGFCSLCDGAVLVLTANRTRQEAAIRAKEQLLQCDVELVGTVLDGRTFPIPESIYRRL